MKNKGFTLIELLAVIVILAVIALITTPMILNVIEGSKKGALKDSAYGLMESADIYYAEHTIDGINKKTEFTFEDGIQTSIEQLGYKGRIEKGSLRLYRDGKVALCITDGKYTAIKNVNEEEVRISNGRCSYNEETEEYETVGICSDLESELEKVKEENNKKIEEIRNEYEEKISNLKNDYEEQKKTIENTYKDQIEELNRRIEELENNKETEIDQIRADYEAQVKTQQEAYEAQINELNRELNIFKTGGTASASQILAGQTAFVKGNLITGSMANNGAVSSNLNAGGSYTIPAGYHDGNGKVTANSLASQTQATATVAHILTGKTAWVNGNKVMGSMANKSGQTVTSNVVTQSGENVLITVPENGYYNTSSQISVPVETIQNSVDVGGMPDTFSIEVSIPVTVGGQAGYGYFQTQNSTAVVSTNFMIGDTSYTVTRIVPEQGQGASNSTSSASIHCTYTFTKNS